MKLTKIKGIAHDLIHNLEERIWFLDLKNLPDKIDKNIIKQKNNLDKECVNFFKSRLPETFDFSRIKEINLKIDKSTIHLKIKIEIKVDNEKLIYKKTFKKPPGFQIIK